MALRLEIFESAEKTSIPDTLVLDVGALEEAKLSAYDTGYSAGWEDAAAAQQGDQTRIKADLARNLQMLGFTYQEARSHILPSIEPLLTQIVGRLLPALARETLAAIVLENLMPLADSLSDVEVKLVLNPAARASVAALVETATGLPVQIEDEPSLGEGQAYLRFGQSEILIDLDRAVIEITAAVRGFFELPQKDTQNG